MAYAAGMTFPQAMESVSLAFELVGVAVFAIGSLVLAVRIAGGYLGARPRMTYVGVRNELGRIILLGLEILIIADIIRTITVDLTLENAATLGVIVLVRTFLSFSLEVELEGAPPWRRLELARAIGAVLPDRPEAHPRDDAR
jgi:uncharacterized membrane protein